MLFWLWQSMFFSALTSNVPAACEETSPVLLAKDTDTCLQALLDNRFLLRLDSTGIVQQVSSNAFEMLDIEPCHIGQLNLVSLLHSTHKPLFFSNGNKAGMPLQKRAQLRHRCGNYVWYSLTYHSHPEGILLIMEPVNMLVEAERSLRNAQIEAEYNVRERGEFLRHMSHELRTPLNAILGFAEMMERGVFGAIENETYNEYLGLIRESGEDLLAKIGDLMDLSAVGAHHIVMQEEKISLNDIMNAAVDRLQKVAINAQVNLHYAPPSNLVTLNADARILRKAIGHIILNAIEYNKVGGRVDITAKQDSDGGLRISIADNGRGIHNSQLKALNYALNDETNLYSNVEAYRPMGLGLTLAKEYLALHGGYVEIESSRLKHGTVVSLVIPPDRTETASAKRYNKVSHLRLAT